MKVLAKKMSSLGLLRLKLIIGTITMVTAMISLPVGIAIIDAALLLNPYVLGTIIAGMLFFGLVAFFGFIRPYLIYNKSPDVLVETDGEFLYIHSKREAKILLKDIELATVYVSLPFLFQNDFLEELIIHLFSENYGTVHLDISGYRSFKLRFVSNVQDTGDNLIRFIQASIDNAN